MKYMAILLQEKSLSRNPLKNSLSGFTLLEVLVALIILGLCFTIIMQLISGALILSKSSRDYTKASLLCRRIMEEALSQNVVKNEEGEEDGMKYIVETEPITLYEDEEEDKLPFKEIKTKVTVLWRVGKREKKVIFSSLKLVPKEKEE